ncbi:Secreted RxLR effector peptide [Phytophthora palmivora]|uniref:RxLR effector protein n=1 Tax=Phytophthora palmivora TaxID=4796 RepID=A0A2P4X1D2_9STRA|nr:Secreted RxLR effector peptide [Phytophthora palmivora]
MRLSYTFLLAIATAIVSSGSAATVSGRTTAISAMASPELTGIGQVIGGGKRSLRYHDNDDRNDKEGEENVDEEERAGGANIYATKKLDEMLASVKRAKNGDDGGMKKVFKRFAKWRKADYNPYNPPTVVDQEKYLKLRQAYKQWLY